jgi:hypothetical protein
MIHFKRFVLGFAGFVAASGVLLAAGTVMLGAHVDDEGSATVQADIQALEANIGRPLAIDSDYEDWMPTSNPSGFPNLARIAWDKAAGRMTMISWRTDFTAASPAGGCATAADIVAGKYDTQLVGQAKAIAGAGVNVLVRWHYEMTDNDDDTCFNNGVPVSSDFVQAGANFVASWKHIVDLFRTNGASNVQWVWAPSATLFSNKSGAVDPVTWTYFYPGDSYVDWIACDRYNKTDTPENAAADLNFADFYAQMSGRGKPLMISETAANNDPAQNPDPQTLWLTTLRTTIKTQYPAIRAFVWWDVAGSDYFNANPNYGGTGYQLTGPGLAAFKALANDPYFGGSAGQGSTGQLKPALQGLIDMGNIAFGSVDDGTPPTNTLADIAAYPPGTFSAYVLNVSWWQLQSAATSLDTTVIDQALAAVRTYNASVSVPIRVKLRVWTGANAPDWAKNLGGAPITVIRNSSGLPITIGRFWSAAYRQAIASLQSQLAAKYDLEPLIAEVSNTSCSNQTDEPFITTGDATSIANEHAAGWTDALYQKCLMDSIQDYSGWTNTRIDFAFSPFKHTDGATTSSDVNFTFQVMQAFRAALGPRAVLSQHSMSNPVDPNVAPVYADMQSVGPLIEFQTQSPLGLDWQGAIQNAISYGAGAIELWNGPGNTGLQQFSSSILQDWASLITTSSVFTGSMPHLAAEGGWNTTFTLVNKTAAPAQAQVTTLNNSGAQLPLPISFLQQVTPVAVTAASATRTLGANASWIVQASGPANVPYFEGSAQLNAALGSAVDGFAIFHYNPTNQEAVVPMETRNAASYVLAFDNTNGVLTGVAIQNLSSFAATIPVIIRDDTGKQIFSGNVPKLNGFGHSSFVLSTQFPATANIRGTMEFDTPNFSSSPPGKISVLGIRYTGGTLTTIPVLANVGTNGGLMAHLASGAGWQTSFALVNTGTTTATATLNFYADNGNPQSLPLTVLETGATSTASFINETLAPGASVWIQSGGPLATALLTGSAQLSTTGNISGYAVFRYNPNGQEAVVPIESRNAKSYLLAFDNTGGDSHRRRAQFQ